MKEYEIERIKESVLVVRYEGKNCGLGTEFYRVVNSPEGTTVGDLKNFEKILSHKIAISGKKPNKMKILLD